MYITCGMLWEQITISKLLFPPRLTVSVDKFAAGWKDKRRAEPPPPPPRPVERRLTSPSLAVQRTPIIIPTILYYIVPYLRLLVHSRVFLLKIFPSYSFHTLPIYSLLTRVASTHNCRRVLQNTQMEFLCSVRLQFTFVSLFHLCSACPRFPRLLYFPFRRLPKPLYYCVQIDCTAMFYTALLGIFLVYRIGARRIWMMLGIQGIAVFQEGLDLLHLRPFTAFT